MGQHLQVPGATIILSGAGVAIPAGVDYRRFVAGGLHLVDGGGAVGLGSKLGRPHPITEVAAGIGQLGDWTFSTRAEMPAALSLSATLRA